MNNSHQCILNTVEQVCSAANKALAPFGIETRPFLVRSGLCMPHCVVREL